MTNPTDTKCSHFVLAAFCVLVIATALGSTACQPESKRAPGATPSATAKGATAGSATAAASTPASAKGKSKPKAGAGLDAQGQMVVGDDDRCPVCAMRVKEHPKFASAIALDDGTTYYFCGTGCMMRSWLHPEVFLGADPKRLDRAVTPEYFTGKHVDATSVVWVAGSDVVGPMGPALVPLADDASATKFKERHGGKTTFKLGELTDEKWEKMTGKKAGR